MSLTSARTIQQWICTSKSLTASKSCLLRLVALIKAVIVSQFELVGKC